MAMRERSESETDGKILDRAWERIQRKAFTAWVNSHLKKTGMQVEEIERDFHDGIRLAKFLEVISGDTIRGITSKPKFKIHKVQNVNACLDFIKSKDIRLVGIGAEDLIEQNLKLVLGMVWTLILRFQIQDISVEDMSAKEGLLLWVQRRTEPYPGLGKNVTNFHFSFQDGRAFCALIHRHRPDLLNYEELDKESKAKNLQLAFDVAEKELGIPAMLDVDGMLNVPKPDERSVMTYVAEYFHAFSASQKADVAGRRIARVIDFTIANDGLRSKYVDLVEELIAWIKEKTEYFTSPAFPNNMEALQEKVQEMKLYRSSEKPPRASQVTEVETMFNSLQTKLRLNNRPGFEPPEGMFPKDVSCAWDGLEKSERDFRAALRLQLLRQKEIEALMTRGRARVGKAKLWAEARRGYLGSDVSVESLSEAEAKIRNHQLFEEEFQSFGSTTKSLLLSIFEELERLEASAETISSLRDQYETFLEESWNPLWDECQNRKTRLDELLARWQEIEEELLAFAKHSAALAMWVEATDDSLSQPLLVQDAQQVHKFQEDFETFLQAFENQKLEEYKALCALSEKLQQNGVSESKYSLLSQADVAKLWSTLEETVQRRREALLKESQVQEEIDVLCKSTAEKAIPFAENCTGLLQRLQQPQEGNLEEQLAKVQEMGCEVTSLEARLEEINELYVQLEDRLVTENPYTELTIETLKLQMDAVLKTSRDQQEVIRNQIAEKADCGLSSDTLREFRECFDYFDKSRNGILDKMEFKACLQSLGMELTDEEVDAVITQYGLATKGAIRENEFVEYMVHESTHQDTPEQLKEAFLTISNNPNGVSEDQLRAVITGQHLDYLLENMLPNSEGLFDFESFTEEVYSR